MHRSERRQVADEFMFRPAIELAGMVRSGEVSARDLVEASLASIGRLNGELNAFVTLCEERAIAEADAVAANDERPLAGVPIAIKDLPRSPRVCARRSASTAMADFVPADRQRHGSAPARCGRNRRRQDELPELGILPVTEPDLFGPTRNPWDTGARRGAPPVAAPQRWPPGWFRSPTPTTAEARSAFRPPAAGWWG